MTHRNLDIWANAQLPERKRIGGEVHSSIEKIELQLQEQFHRQLQDNFLGVYAYYKKQFGTAPTLLSKSSSSRQDFQRAHQYIKSLQDTRELWLKKFWILSESFHLNELTISILDGVLKRYVEHLDKDWEVKLDLQTIVQDLQMSFWEWNLKNIPDTNIFKADTIAFGRIFFSDTQRSKKIVALCIKAYTNQQIEAKDIVEGGYDFWVIAVESILDSLSSSSKQQVLKKLQELQKNPTFRQYIQSSPNIKVIVELLPEFAGFFDAEDKQLISVFFENIKVSLTSLILNSNSDDALIHDRYVSSQTLSTMIQLLENQIKKWEGATQKIKLIVQKLLDLPYFQSPEQKHFLQMIQQILWENNGKEITDILVLWLSMWKTWIDSSTLETLTSFKEYIELLDTDVAKFIGASSEFIDNYAAARKFIELFMNVTKNLPPEKRQHVAQFLHRMWEKTWQQAFVSAFLAEADTHSTTSTLKSLWRGWNWWIQKSKFSFGWFFISKQVFWDITSRGLIESQRKETEATLRKLFEAKFSELIKQKLIQVAYDSPTKLKKQEIVKLIFESIEEYKGWDIEELKWFAHKYPEVFHHIVDKLIQEVNSQPSIMEYALDKSQAIVSTPENELLQKLDILTDALFYALKEPRSDKENLRVITDILKEYNLEVFLEVKIFWKSLIENLLIYIKSILQKPYGRVELKSFLFQNVRTIQILTSKKNPKDAIEAAKIKEEKLKGGVSLFLQLVQRIPVLSSQQWLTEHAILTNFLKSPVLWTLEQKKQRISTIVSDGIKVFQYIWKNKPINKREAVVVSRFAREVFFIIHQIAKSFWQEWINIILSWKIYDNGFWKDATKKSFLEKFKSQFIESDIFSIAWLFVGEVWKQFFKWKNVSFDAINEHVKLTSLHWFFIQPTNIHTFENMLLRVLQYKSSTEDTMNSFFQHLK